LLYIKQNKRVNISINSNFFAVPRLFRGKTEADNILEKYNIGILNFSFGYAILHMLQISGKLDFL